MDFILQRRKKVIALSNGQEVVIYEMAAKDADSFLEILKRDRPWLYLGQILDLLFKDVPNNERPKEDDIFHSDYKLLCNTAAELVKCEGLIYDTATSKRSSLSFGDNDCPDASIFYMLDAIGARYGSDPFALYERLTYRQIIYCFVMAYNSVLDNYAIHGLKPKNGESFAKLNARGLTIDPASLPKSAKMAHYAKLAKEIREERERNGR